MKKIFTIVILCFLAFSSLTAQSFNSALFVSDVLLLDTYIKRQNKDVNFKDTKSYKGTPYNHPNFLYGNIYKEGTLLAEKVAIRYLPLNHISDPKNSRNSRITLLTEKKNC